MDTGDFRDHRPGSQLIYYLMTASFAPSSISGNLIIDSHFKRIYGYYNGDREDR